MSKHSVKKGSIYDEITIFGHTFHGLREIRETVEVLSSIGNGELKDGKFEGWREPYISFKAPAARVPGVHVMEVYERYPCFDSEDYAYENRYFSNYFFSPKPFTKEEVMMLALLPYRGYSALDVDYLPDGYQHIFYVGDRDRLDITV